MTNPIKIEMDFTNPFVKMLISVNGNCNERQGQATSRRIRTLPPYFHATGMSVKPIVVITEPVTMAGKNFASFENAEINDEIPDNHALNIAPLPWF